VTQRNIPVLINYDFSTPVGGQALFDPETGVLTMTLRPGPVRDLVADSSEFGVVVGMSIQSNYPIGYPKTIDSLASDLVTALHENSCDHADRDCGLVESDEAIIRSVLAKHGVPLADI
jgi:hypothetical protein